MININNIHFHYRKSDFYLKIPELSIAHGEKIAFVGPSGSGKTTLLNLLAGITVPDKGFITIENEEINSLNDAQRRDFRISNIGFVFQSFELIDYLNVKENILFPYLINHSLTITAAVKDRAKTLAENLGLGNYLKRNIDKLSQGERQRVAIARAMVTDPKIILADEPTGNLDPSTKKQILDLLLAQVKQTNATLIMVTHDHSLLQHFDRTVDFEKFSREVPK